MNLTLKINFRVPKWGWGHILLLNEFIKIDWDSRHHLNIRKNHDVSFSFIFSNQVYTGCSLEDLPGAMERVREIYGVRATWFVFYKDIKINCINRISLRFFLLWVSQQLLLLATLLFSPWVWVSLGAPFIRPCVTSKQKKKSLVDCYIYIYIYIYISTHIYYIYIYMYTQPIHMDRMWHNQFFKQSLTGLNSVFFLKDQLPYKG